METFFERTTYTLDEKHINPNSFDKQSVKRMSSVLKLQYRYIPQSVSIALMTKIKKDSHFDGKIFNKSEYVERQFKLCKV